jgi:hypothetical protein
VREPLRRWQGGFGSCGLSGNREFGRFFDNRLGNRYFSARGFLDDAGRGDDDGARGLAGLGLGGRFVHFGRDFGRSLGRGFGGGFILG